MESKEGLIKQQKVLDDDQSIFFIKKPSDVMVRSKRKRQIDLFHSNSVEVEGYSLRDVEQMCQTQSKLIASKRLSVSYSLLPLWFIITTFSINKVCKYEVLAQSPAISEPHLETSGMRVLANSNEPSDVYWMQ